MADWPTVVSRHGQAAWQTAYRLLGDPDEAADCLQEVLLEALEISRRQRVRHWSALLRHLCTYRAIDRLRRRLRRAEDHWDPAEWTGVPCNDPGPVEQAEAAELSGRLRRAIAQLPPQQATVFCLRCIEELSYRDIARQLGLRTSNVGVLLHRARARLRELLSSAKESPAV
ncbi:MAG TPA: sigma-70 family RNA polymerase sigma factor [Phycisphaerae bacterium]|nr:sigma-70 family RNA polymerase sigma factor [Phycisphaerae bacterium]